MMREAWPSHFDHPKAKEGRSHQTDCQGMAAEMEGREREKREKEGREMEESESE